MAGGNEEQLLAVRAPRHGSVLEVTARDLKGLRSGLAEWVDDEHMRPPVDEEPEVVLAILQGPDSPGRLGLGPASGVAAFVGNACDVGDAAGIGAPHWGFRAESLVGNAPGLAAVCRHDIQLRFGMRPIPVHSPQERQPGAVWRIDGRGVTPAGSQRA